MSTSRRLRGALWLGLSLGLSLALHACAQPLCQLRHTPALPLRAVTAEEVTTAQWAMLLLRGPSHSCVGEPTLPARLQGLAPLEHPRHQLVANGAGPGRHIVWLQTHGDEHGVYGPVAVVAQAPGSLGVEALGTLMLPRGQVRLNLSPLGPGRALWATTTACRPDAAVARALCRTQMQVLPWIGDRLVMAQEAQLFDLKRQEVVPLAAGWRRRIEHEAELSQHDGALVLQERLVIWEVAGRDGSVPPRHRRELQGRRTLAFSAAAGWQASGPSLWARSQAEGSGAR